MSSKINTWKDCGMKKFILDNSLLEAFKATDIPMDSNPIDFKYPFETFLIEGKSILFKTEDGESVHNIMYTSSKAAMDEYTNIVTREGEVRKSLDWNHSITAFFLNKESLMESIWLNCRDDQTLADACNVRQTGLAVFDVAESENRKMLNIFYNTILYINDPKRRPETQERRSERIREYKGGPWKESKYIYLRPPKSYVSISSGKHWRLDKTIIVRGHWRQQAYGEKHSLRRQTWILPYRKGSTGDVYLKPYRVGA
jgi:hypothetical protein